MKVFRICKLAFLLLIGTVNLSGQIKVGAERFDLYEPFLKEKHVGVVGNHTSLVAGHHLVDYLLENEIQVIKVFSPEHGFRGKADAGSYVKSGKDEKTGLPLISLYGKNKKPRPDQLNDVDVMLFDLQDVGARFYTYLSTLHYVMEACAENNIPLIVLDRPNPNMDRIDGPMLEKEKTSFVGLHPIPVLHGNTLGEMARMINGEGWLKGGVKCQLTVVKVADYTRDMVYKLPVKPSPNLPSPESIWLYPSLCFFEGTIISVGRGTDRPFTQFGHPAFKYLYSHRFVPQPNEGASKPKLNGYACYGRDLIQEVNRNEPGLKLEWLIEAYRQYPIKSQFFNAFFDTLAGTKQLKMQIMSGCSLSEIRQSWQNGLNEYREMRKPYLLY